MSTMCHRHSVLGDAVPSIARARWPPGPQCVGAPAETSGQGSSPPGCGRGGMCCTRGCNAAPSSPLPSRASSDLGGTGRPTRARARVAGQRSAAAWYQADGIGGPAPASRRGPPNAAGWLGNYAASGPESGRFERREPGRALSPSLALESRSHTRKHTTFGSDDASEIACCVS